jgi:hypothetical protein
MSEEGLVPYLGRPLFFLEESAEVIVDTGNEPMNEADGLTKY